MKTTKVSTIREHVIALHRHAGFSPSESIRLWDDVYSREYYNSKPGVKHTWVIGEYQFEFTKQPVDPIETEAQAAEITSRALSWVKLIATLLVIVIVLIFLTTTLFEDGSFITLGFIKGCLPWGICNL